jgi:hypothetical protein
MKNLHLLQTDKPSRLILQGIELLISKYMEENEGFSELNQYLYITNDEEIKERDWHLNIVTNKISKYNIGLLNPNRSNYKKIILTTDPDLIKDGVQEIDEEYLEWFVKNPSCDYVEIEDSVWDGISKWIPYYDIIIPEEPNPCKDIVINDKATIDVPFHNKPIRFENLTSEQAGYLLQVSEFYQLSGTRRSAVVPQEEPKQIKCYCGHTITCDCEPLQETFEEFINQSNTPEGLDQFSYDKGLEDGAKWQQERMYSEEDMINFAHFYFKEEYNLAMMEINKTTKELLSEWFEQYKKK